MKSTKDQKKAQAERDLFRQFANAMSWPIEPDLIKNLEPPQPDILYDGPNCKIAFELVENCSENLAHNNSKLINGNGQILINTSDPTIKIVREKLANKYITDYPIELLCYSNGKLATPNDMAVARMKNELEVAPQNPFRRVWYFGKQNKVFMVWEK